MGSVLFSMNAEASADLHRNRHRRAIGWQLLEERGRPAWVWPWWEVASESHPRRVPAPTRRALAPLPASCKWRAPRQMRSSGSRDGGGSSWHFLPPLSGGSQGTAAPCGLPPASLPEAVGAAGA